MEVNSLRSWKLSVTHRTLVKTTKTLNNMKKFYYIFAATAGLLLAGCANDDLIVENAPEPTDAEMPILFSSVKKGMTRADATGAEAAALLGNQFVVSGYKGSSTATVGTIVFDNYAVKYTENTANTTQSNSDNWEYVGVDRIKHAIDNGITSQQIKYWDYSQAQYDFIAWSTGTKTAIYENTPNAGEVLVSAITPETATGTGTGKVAYTFTGTAADLSNVYIADLVTVKKAQYGDNPVTFRFRQLGTKVRIAIYETVPGYSVKDVKFYSAAASDDAGATPKIFTTAANEIYTEGTYTVSYPTVDSSDPDNNQAHVTFAPRAGVDQKTTVEWGGLNYTIAEEGEKNGTEFLGRSSSTASYAGDAANNYYVIFMPNETGTNLNLRVNYTLESIDGSGEEITVKGATAQVPSIYTTWKPGFAYTYVFKISDKTNGYTGVYDPTKPDDTTVNSDPAGLYPITFDAVVENAEDNDATQETITLISTPSITTYQKGSNVVNNDEYLAATGDIFVTVNDGDAESTPDLANGKLQTLTGKAALYTIPEGKTEAEVIDALQMQDDDAATDTVKGRSGLVLTEASFDLTDKVEYGVDGNAITVDPDQAARFTPTANTTYAFVYTKKAPTANTDYFQAVTKADGASVEGFYRFAQIAAPAGDVQKGVKYFPDNTAAAGMLTVFVGQGVSNLYTRSGAGTATDPYVYTIASGYAVTGTDYYYTTDKGMTYTLATNIAYADFATATLYTYDSSTQTFTVKTETEPDDGTAYYAAENLNSYCVILPEQTNSKYIIDEAADKVACAATDKAVNGMTYFDKYTKNDGVYYTKVIKVQ